MKGAEISARKLMMVFTCLLLVGTMFVPFSQADEWNETIFTFNEPVEVPGTVLPAGKYVFRLSSPIRIATLSECTNADEREYCHDPGNPDINKRLTRRSLHSTSDRRTLRRPSGRGSIQGIITESSSFIQRRGLRCSPKRITDQSSASSCTGSSPSSTAESCSGQRSQTGRNRSPAYRGDCQCSTSGNPAAAHGQFSAIACNARNVLAGTRIGSAAACLE